MYFVVRYALQFYSTGYTRWCLVQCSWELTYDKSAQKASRKLQKFQGRNLDNIFVAILVQMMTPKRHFEINWPLHSNQWESLSVFWMKIGGKSKNETCRGERLICWNSPKSRNIRIGKSKILLNSCLFFCCYHLNWCLRKFAIWNGMFWQVCRF